MSRVINKRKYFVPDTRKIEGDFSDVINPFIIFPLKDVDSLPLKTRQKISDIYSHAYGKGYCRFENAFKNVDQILLTIRNGKTIGAVSLSRKRIIRFGVGPCDLRKEVAIQMLSRLKNKKPDIWLTAGINYPKIHKLLQESGFKICNEKNEIQKHFPGRDLIFYEDGRGSLSFTKPSRTTGHPEGYKQYLFY